MRKAAWRTADIITGNAIIQTSSEREGQDTGKKNIVSSCGPFGIDEEQ